MMLWFYASYSYRCTQMLLVYETDFKNLYACWVEQIWIKSKNVKFHNFTVKLFNFVWIYEPVYPRW